ncbi:MAG: CinA family protein [Aeromicrobium sp.]|uniref:CinA family protein n=1 Tax=Aeromicrobium sp. TaxID=1871063 RepID=UPI0039E6B972
MASGEAAEVVAALAARGWTVATAESLTGGLLCGALVGVPGASAVVRGGVVAYWPEVKRDALGVDGALIAERGTIDPDVARAMAEGVRSRLGADVGLATTGNAGPDASEGKPVGRAHIAVVTPDGAWERRLDLAGSRQEIRDQVVGAALAEALATLGRDATA